MRSHPHHLGWARRRFQGYAHVHLFSSILSISGTGKECDLMTVREKALIILPGRALHAVKASQLSRAQKRHCLGC